MAPAAINALHSTVCYASGCSPCLHPLDGFCTMPHCKKRRPSFWPLSLSLKPGRPWLWSFMLTRYC